MKTFTSLKLPISITTGYENPIEDFFVPILKNAKTYDVAVGYFTSGWLRDAAEGFAEFALSGGVSRWVVSPELNTKDVDSIMEPLGSTYPNLEDMRERQLYEVIKSLKDDTRRELCALIASNIIEFRIAVPRKNKFAMLHAKLGIAVDKDQNIVAFNGSYNMTVAAKSNWERIDIFKSWEQGDNKRVKDIQNRFENLWANDDPSYEVLTPSSELATLIKKEAGTKLQDFLDVKNQSELPIKLRWYQEKAIKNWGNNNGQGTFVMATGSGKTFTALATIKKLLSLVSKKNKPLVIVIILPLKHLLDQWYEEAVEFGFTPIKCYESSEVWKKKFAEQMGVLKVTKSGYVMAMVTNSTFGLQPFQTEISKIDQDFLIVADEAHNLGSPIYLEALPDKANFRLALSATPERHNDEAGTKALFEYFGDPVIEFTLEDAINADFLSPYKYYPHLCLLSEVEYEEYLELSELIAEEAENAKDSGERTKEHIRLLGKRTDLISGVESKLEKLEELLEEQRKNSGVKHTLVYCGSRRGEDSDRHIERTVKLIGKLDIKARKFTAEESLDERREILDLFSKGELEAIAAIKCLDEGVDIPATRVAYILASTMNPREHIQRRGRVLRKVEGKEFAVIHDFLVAPPQKYSDHDMVERELDRAREFSDLALNKDECQIILEELATDNGIEGWK